MASEVKARHPMRDHPNELRDRVKGVYSIPIASLDKSCFLVLLAFPNASLGMRYVTCTVVAFALHVCDNRQNKKYSPDASQFLRRTLHDEYMTHSLSFLYITI
jgi:hypothetical protein